MAEPIFFDAHTHLNIQFDDDWREVGERALQAGVWFVNVGADSRSSDLALKQAKTLGEGVWATAGIHPTEGDDINFATVRELAKDEKTVAIGECGLEYFRLKDDKDKERQKKLFEQHIELAVELGKPLMIHCREAYGDTWEILNFYKNQVGDRLRFNMHFFAGDWVVAQKFLDLGGSLSFPGVITFSDQYDEVVKNLPLGQIMSETDAPFVAPVPNRGRRNEPAYVQFITEKITNLRPESKEEVLLALVSNARNFFGV